MVNGWFGIPALTLSNNPLTRGSPKSKPPGPKPPTNHWCMRLILKKHDLMYRATLAIKITAAFAQLKRSRWEFLCRILPALELPKEKNRVR